MVGILEMNKSIFVSTFIEKKSSIIARKEMAMDLMVPNNAVDLTSEEMEYIDGGFTITAHKFYFVPVGVIITWSKAECADIAALGAGSVAILGLATYFSGPAAPVFALLTGLAGGSSALFWYASNRNGLRIKTVGITIVSIERL